MMVLWARWRRAVLPPARSGCEHQHALPTTIPHSHAFTPPPPLRSVDAFVERCRELANVTAGNDIMLTIGSDFQFANAHLQ